MAELEQISSTYHETKRQLELARTTIESGKQEFERALAQSKSRHQEEVAELAADNQAL